jgi:hypothetical protein
VPHEPVPLNAIIEEAWGNGGRSFDTVALRARTLLRLEWDDGSTWDAWVIVLPSQVKLYCDSGGDEDRILASGGRNMGDETDRLFLELLADSGGQHFGIEMSGGTPSRVRSSIDDRSFLVDVFVNLFEGTALEQTMRRDPTDFRSDVEQWLARAME